MHSWTSCGFQSPSWDAERQSERVKLCLVHFVWFSQQEAGTHSKEFAKKAAERFSCLLCVFAFHPQNTFELGGRDKHVDCGHFRLGSADGQVDVAQVSEGLKEHIHGDLCAPQQRHDETKRRSALTAGGAQRAC